MFKQILTIITLLILSASCFAKDGPPRLINIDLHAVENPIPKWEPMSKIGNNPIYRVKKKYYRVLPSSHGYREVGVASWYGRLFHKRRTSNGEVYNMFEMSAAHKSLPLPTYVRVRNLDNQKEIIVRVNDRGPFKKGRIIDLSYVAAKKLGMLKNGTARVEVTAINPDLSQTNSDPIINNNDYLDYDNEYVEEPDIYLQVGAFSTRERADFHATQVSQITDNPVQLDLINTSNGKFYRVQVGPLNADTTEHIQSKLKAAGLGEFFTTLG